MAETTTIARPYASAIFALASEKGTVDAWSISLDILAEQIQNDKVLSLVKNPLIDNETTVDILAAGVDDAQKAVVKQYLTVLADNNRLLLLEDIASLFHKLCDEVNQVMVAKVTTAKALTAKQKKAISSALNKRTGRDVTLDIEVDEQLLGGAVIRAGDLVIDGSALGKLNRLASVMH